MTAVTNGTTTSEVGELIPSEFILSMIGEGNYAPRVFHAVAQTVPVQRGSSNVVSIVTAPSTTISSGSTLTENDEDTGFTAFDPTEVTVTLATRGIRRESSWEARFHDSTQTLEASMIRSSFNAVMDQQDKYVLGQAVNATNSYAGTDLAFDIEAFEAATAQFRALNPNYMGLKPAMVLHSDQMRDLRTSLRTSGGSLAANTSYPVDLEALFGMKAGDPIMYQGVWLFESPNVAATNSANWSGFITTLGDQSGLVRAVAVDPSEGEIAAELGVIFKMTGPGSDRDNKLQKCIAVYTRYGAAIARQSNFMEIVSQT